MSLMMNVAPEQYLCSAAVTLADVGALLLTELRQRMPLPADGVTPLEACAALSPVPARDDAPATVRAPAL